MSEPDEGMTVRELVVFSLAKRLVLGADVGEVRAYLEEELPGLEEGKADQLIADAQELADSEDLKSLKPIISDLHSDDS